MSKRFDKLCKEGVEVTRKVAEMSRRQNYKLTGPAFVKAALELAKTNMTRLMEIQQVLETDKTGAFGHTNQGLRNCRRFIKDGSCTRPPDRVSRLNWLFTRTDEVVGELAVIQSSIPEIFALAAVQVAETNPEAFGSNENWNEFVEELEATKKRQGELYGRISSEWSPDDIIIGKVIANGVARISFRASGGEVCVSDNCGEALVKWLLEHVKE